MDALKGDWYCLDTALGEPAWNMALDETLLLKVAVLAKPVLRFYGWTEPAATFGYSQRVAEIEALTHLRPVIRRPTGGGLVPHDFDWTYSVIVPPGHPWYELSAVESYRTVHEWVAAGLNGTGLNGVTLADCCLKPAPGQCFLGYEKYDVLWSGKKVAGAAQRRSKNGLLIQGSLQPPRSLSDRTKWQAAMLASASTLGARFEDLALTPELLVLTDSLASSKYRTFAFNRRL